jgi:hypothetical protein
MTMQQHQPLYQVIARTLKALERCQSAEANSSQKEWAEKWRDRLANCAAYLPCGSGFDVEPQLSETLNRNGAFQIHGAYHSMSENGYYEGDLRGFTLTVRPSMIDGFELTCSLRGELGDFVCETYETALREQVSPADIG